MKSNRIASIIIESNRELGESFQAYVPQQESVRGHVLVPNFIKLCNGILCCILGKFQIYKYLFKIMLRKL